MGTLVATFLADFGLREDDLEAFRFLAGLRDVERFFVTFLLTERDLDFDFAFLLTERDLDFDFFAFLLTEVDLLLRFADLERDLDRDLDLDFDRDFERDFERDLDLELRFAELDRPLCFPDFFGFLFILKTTLFCALISLLAFLFDARCLPPGKNNCKIIINNINTTC